MSSPPKPAAVELPVASGPSYPLTLRLLASALVGWIVVQAAAPQSRALALALPLGTQVLMLAALGVVLVTFWSLWRSHTSIDATHVRQTWLWRKQTALADIVQVKLIHVRGLEWLITPRLVVRTRTLGVLSFPTADARVLAAFEFFSRGGPPPA